MNLAKLAAKATQTQHRPNHSILLYGGPKTGKTQLVGTSARIPEVKRIFWFDGENGAETLLHMGLSVEEMEKITLFRIPDTREVPRFIETMLKAMSSKKEINICDLHGKVDCQECTKAGNDTTPFLLSSLTHEDLVVIDSGSQLGDSAIALAMAGLGVTAKAEFDHYGAQGKYLSDILGVIQACQNTNFIVITHTLVIEEDVNGIKKDRYFPLMGSRQYCQKVAKYFGTVIYTDIKLGKHAAGSSSTYRNDVLTGSRVNAKIEKSAEISMRAILIEGGILS